MKIILIAVACAAGIVVACTAQPVRKVAHRPAPQSPPAESFTFSSRSLTLGHNGDDPDAEARRIGELEYRLRDNHMCPKGYAITSRRVIVQMGEKDEVVYEARCAS